MPTKTAAKSGAKKKLTWNDEVNARLRTLEVDNVKKGTRIASLRKLVEQHRSDTLTALRNLGTQTENIRERLTALEQAAKPTDPPTAENWEPAKGEWVRVTGECGQGGSRRFIGVVGQLEGEWPNAFINPAWIVKGTGSWFAQKNLRPLSSAEIAEHKRSEDGRQTEHSRPLSIPHHLLTLGTKPRSEPATNSTMHMNNIPEGADTDPRNPANATDFAKYRTVRLVIDYPVYQTEEMAEHTAQKFIESATGATIVSTEIVG